MAIFHCYVSSPEGMLYSIYKLQGEPSWAITRNHSSCCTHHIGVDTAQWLSDWTRGNVSYFNITHSGHSLLRWHCWPQTNQFSHFVHKAQNLSPSSLSPTKCQRNATVAPSQGTDFFSASSGKAWQRWSPVPFRTNSWGKKTKQWRWWLGP